MSVLVRDGLPALPERRIWEGEPFPDPGLVAAFSTLPVDRPADKEGEIPF